MGLDLTLCYDDNPQSEWKLSYFRLRFDRDYEIFAQFKYVGRGVDRQSTIKRRPLPADWKFDWYGSEGVKTETTDCYGTRLTYVTGADMKKLQLTADASPTNRAIHAFIQAAPDDAVYILWWH